MNDIFRLTLATLTPVLAIMVGPAIRDAGLAVYAVGLAAIGLVQVLLLRPYVKAANAEAAKPLHPGGN